MSDHVKASDLTLVWDGATYLPAAAVDVLEDMQGAVAQLPIEQAGVRIHGVKAVSQLLVADGPIGAVALSLFERQCHPVRAVLFDKTPSANWALAWHQDRTICVKQRMEVEGFGPWTNKRGMQHVAPPFELLACMITLRVHLDDVSADNAPLLIAPGSHAIGRVPVNDYAAVVDRCGQFACLAEAGDIWAYATPILHASEAARVTGRRRVLQVDYSTNLLPGGLEWLGV
ncbi:phytanoyl-CoA dioxygenase family protein [Sandaracinobacter sp. RS1-74]|uniref:phytanoyl-CoA dioxygenase family protein n=1 Tax=Sandaracinobacteroides sayramensis TaxID=2913411 RepID=UPI001EDA16AB|nr:phytanoyl-CoA dioxygenase family protein [Sandaracinobacteroides sayramensis]MCG2841808.1 phytanoyl-CoA dioxygenase family protein [Sandaracinobacteroides sayramensis]